MGKRPYWFLNLEESFSIECTMGVVATVRSGREVRASKIAQMAQDGLGRAISQADTMFDGDTIFCLATGRRALPSTEGFFASPTAPAVNELG